MTEENIQPSYGRNTSKNPRDRASFEKAIKRPLLRSARKSIERRRSIIEANSKNTRKALSDETNILKDTHVTVENTANAPTKTVLNDSPSNAVRLYYYVIVKQFITCFYLIFLPSSL